ncbi:MAG: GGDEF domain-containing protein [Acidaminobacteraceae bacterium]
MNEVKVKSILEKNARVLYFDRTIAFEELESISEDVKSFNPAYDLFRRGIISRLIGKSEEALSLCKSALDHGYIHNDIFIIQETSMFMGVITRSIGMYEEALKHYLNSQKYGASARAYNNIADIYLYVGDYSEAQIYLNQAIDMLKNSNERSKLEELLLNTVYTNLSEAELKMGNIEESKISAKKCINLALKLGDKFTLAYGNSLLGLAAQYQKEYELALEYFDKAHKQYLSCDEHSQNKVFDYIEENLRFIADCLSEWGKFEQSIKQLEALKELIKSDYELMIKNYEGLNQDENAYKYYKLYRAFMKHDEEIQRQIRLEHFKSKVRFFETEKKANDYELLYTHTKSIADIGKDIIAAEKLDDVLISLHAHIDKIMKFNSLALAKVDDSSILYNWVLENNERIDSFVVDRDNKNSFSAWAVRNKKEIILNDALTVDELKKYKEEIDTFVYGHAMDSMILCPIIYKDKVYGVINIQSTESYTYSESNLEVIKMLASFIAIAMKNWSDAKSLKLVNEQLESLSKTDALTGISNRHILSEIVVDLFKAGKEDNNIISVVMIDIDHFKEYNDTYGHIEGDRCIVKIVDTLKIDLNIDGNLLFRYGGDEFVAIMPYLSAKDVQLTLDKTKKSIEALKIENKQSKVSKFVTCSFGYTTVQRGQMDYQKAFYLADEALYIAKASGKNCIVSKKF